MIKWQFYPKSRKAPMHLEEIVKSVFVPNNLKITSEKHKFESNKVLEIIRKDLKKNGFKVEAKKGKNRKINIPVLFGQNGGIEKSFDADGWNENSKTVIEIEAGRGVTNYQFLKDFFQACVMQDIECLVICVRNNYLGRDDYGTVIKFFNAIYASGRLKLPLAGIMIIGY